MRWAHDHPEEYAEIAALPLNQQNGALRAAIGYCPDRMRDDLEELARDDEAQTATRSLTSGDDAPRLSRSNASRLDVETTAAELADGKAAPRQGCTNCGAPADAPCVAWCRSEQGS